MDENIIPSVIAALASMTVVILTIYFNSKQKKRENYFQNTKDRLTLLYQPMAIYLRITNFLFSRYFDERTSEEEKINIEHSWAIYNEGILNLIKDNSMYLEVVLNFGENKHHKINIEFKYHPYNLPKNGIDTRILYTEIHESLNRTIVYLLNNPFYHESGGQVNDIGRLVLEDGRIYNVTDSQVNRIVVEGIERNFGDQNVRAIVDYNRRQAIQRNHSATHLVHEALRRVLGSHVKQLGSLVGDEYLRFDFPHFHKVEDNQIKDIEDLVNSKIQEKIEVFTEEKLIEEANKIANVKKFFGEKYGDTVRVVTIDENFSVEFCGGTHVKNTGDIGLFKITKEESIASGTRRIFARTGEGIIKLLNERILDIEKIMNELPEKYSNDFIAAINLFNYDISKADFRDIELMKKLILNQNSTVASLYETRERYLEEKKQLEKQLLKQNLSKVFSKLDELILKPNKVDGFDIIAAKMELNNIDEFKEIGDELRKKIKNGIGLIAVVLDQKINLVCSVSDNLIKNKNLNAGKIINEVAKELGGGGGGKPHLATAGAKDVTKLDEVLSRVPILIKKYINI